MCLPRWSAPATAWPVAPTYPNPTRSKLIISHSQSIVTPEITESFYSYICLRGKYEEPDEAK
jgi:hypothetical protein